MALPSYDFEDLGFPPDIDPDDFVGPGGTTYEFLTVRVRPDAADESRREVLAIAHMIGKENRQIVRTEQRPIAIENYGAVRSTPFVLALLGSMAAATLAHLVLSVVRRRRRDLAVCAALGMHRSQLAGAVVVQALLVVGLSMIVGVPVGLAGGRLAWMSFAADLGVIDTIRFPLLTNGLAVVVVVIVSVTVTAVPAVVTTRMRPALVLRTVRTGQPRVVAQQSRRSSDRYNAMGTAS